MARKKRKTDDKSPKQPVDFPHPRALESVMRQFVAGLQTGGPPLAQAQELTDAAYEERDDERRLQLAKQALRISPDCADAHVLMAELAPTRRQALEHYQQAVAAGERAVGPRAFQEDAGHFWGILETRPYMRARLGLAHALWVTAQRDEAIRHLQDMLRLNPNDNQGVRYTLAGFLLFLDRDDELVRLLARYPNEKSAAWDYTKALLAFRQHGDMPEARELLAQAIKTNQHVPDYLLGTKFPPAAPPDYYSPGHESEAWEYISGFLAAWKSTPGAIAWLRANIVKPKSKLKTKPPTGAQKKSLRKLPQEEDVWQIDARALMKPVMGDAGPVQPWVVLAMSATDGCFLGFQVLEEAPMAAQLWEALVAAMRKPLAGDAHRPAVLQTPPGELWESLRPHIEEIGVTLTFADELVEFDAAFAGLAANLGGRSEPGLLDMPGMTPERVGRFHDAAAEFFRQSPWKQVGYEAAIKIECDRYDSGPWYGVLMGQSGLTTGMALYDDLASLQRMLGGADNRDEANARETVGMSVTFGEEWDLEPANASAVKTHGWPVARPDAYPDVFRKERGLSMRPPLVWELELMEGCMRAVPDFVRRRQQDDPARESFTVPTAGGPLNLVLSWVVEE
jgi:tetratricopeptide (TPR) repeat protein